MRRLRLTKLLVSVALSSSAFFAAPLAAQAATTTPAPASHGVVVTVAAVPDGSHWEFIGETFELNDNGLKNCHVRGEALVAAGEGSNYSCLDGDPHADEYNLWILAYR